MEVNITQYILSYVNTDTHSPLSSNLNNRLTQTSVNHHIMGMTGIII